MKTEIEKFDDKGISPMDLRNLNKSSEFFQGEENAFRCIPYNWDKLNAKKKNALLGEKFFDEEEEARQAKAKAIAIMLSKKKKYLRVERD